VAISQVSRILSCDIGEPTALKLSVHPYMFRHGKGYQLPDEGVDTMAMQAYMGHKTLNIRSNTPSSIQSVLRALEEMCDFEVA
jgi:site-specific recombinase XerD